eukprot:scaffold4770_cov139-Skeletonema_marinoi.AAC.9
MHPFINSKLPNPSTPSTQPVQISGLLTSGAGAINSPLAPVFGQHDVTQRGKRVSEAKGRFARGTACF